MPTFPPGGAGGARRNPREPPPTPTAAADYARPSTAARALHGASSRARLGRERRMTREPARRHRIPVARLRHPAARKTCRGSVIMRYRTSPAITATVVRSSRQLSADTARYRHGRHCYLASGLLNHSDIDESNRYRANADAILARLAGSTSRPDRYVLALRSIFDTGGTVPYGDRFSVFER